MCDNLSNSPKFFLVESLRLEPLVSDRDHFYIYL